MPWQAFTTANRGRIPRAPPGASYLEACAVAGQDRRAGSRGGYRSALEGDLPALTSRCPATARTPRAVRLLVRRRMTTATSGGRQSRSGPGQVPALSGPAGRGDRTGARRAGRKRAAGRPCHGPARPCALSLRARVTAPSQQRNRAGSPRDDLCSCTVVFAACPRDGAGDARRSSGVRGESVTPSHDLDRDQGQSSVFDQPLPDVPEALTCRKRWRATPFHSLRITTRLSIFPSRRRRIVDSDLRRAGAGRSRDGPRRRHVSGEPGRPLCR